MRVIKGRTSWQSERELIGEQCHPVVHRLTPFRIPIWDKNRFTKKRKSKIEKKISHLPKMSAGPRPTASSSQPLTGFRLGFSPSYILVGVYRLSTDPLLRVPVWKKCKHGFIRGLVAGLVWVSVQTTATDASHGRRISLLSCLVSPGVPHVWNSKELHPALPVKVRSVLVHMTRYSAFILNPTPDPRG